MNKVRNRNFIGRAYVKVSYVKDKGMHKAEKDPGATRKVLSHLRYIGFRSREMDADRDTYGLFDKDRDHAPLKEFYEKIKNDPALRHSQTIKMHKLIIGFHRDWYDKYQINYKDLVRHIMRSLEERKGMKLEWVAAEHLKETSPHAHVAIKSTGVNDFGKTKRLFITKEDIEWIKEEIDRYTGREQILEREKELERDEIMPDILKELSKELERQAREGERRTQQAKKEQERERERDR